MPSRAASAALARVRKIVLALEGTSERVSHGSPTWFVGGGKGRSLAMFLDDHHGDGRLALWCAAPAGLQAMLVEQNPEAYFVPPYVGHMGWVGVRLDRGLGWGEVEQVLAQAWESARLKLGRGGAPGRARPARARAAGTAARAPRR